MDLQAKKKLKKINSLISTFLSKIENITSELTRNLGWGGGRRALCSWSIGGLLYLFLAQDPVMTNELNGLEIGATVLGLEKLNE
ncbi:Uncharacterized protein TCM_006579 [Theobroma cacao]|uniref:Uncharacterized protein n=1 Tax=Theobroma cacao TaxID=3641 RepID=A0A061DZV2_THECC|nr:Uncharacterized protein TCM_006579 [Theobroma cacao]